VQAHDKVKLIRGSVYLAYYCGVAIETSRFLVVAVD